MSTRQIRDAAYAVVNGGVGFVPLPPHCRNAAKVGLQNLVKLGEYRKRMGRMWGDSKWGYQLDDKNQFDRGLSQWRADERKDVFHFEPSTPGILHEQGAPVQNWDNFFEPCATIYRLMSELGAQCAEEFDRILPGFAFSEACQAENPLDVVRLLAYERRRTPGEVAAESHRDRDLFSLHVFETAPGFFVGHDEKTQVRLSTPPGQAAIFAGRKFEQMTGSAVKALWHGTCEVPQLEPQGRRAVVFFKHSNVPLVRTPGELTKELLLV